MMTKKTQYNQTQVNENMEQLFDMPASNVRSTTDIRKTILKSEPLVNNQNVQTEEVKPKKKGRGGARPNSGRKVGSTVKLSAADLLAEIARQDKPFAEGLAEDYARARTEGDLMIVQRYQQMFLSKVLADKSEVDVTSNGQTMGVAFNFPTTELAEWHNDPTTKH